MYSAEQLADPAVISKLKQENGPELRAVQTSLGYIVFKKPMRDAWDRWQDKSLVSKATASTDARELCQECLATGCSYDDLRAALDAKPGLLQGEFMTAIGELAGWAEKFEVKKL
jgi:hypothetical protein